jgi:predicted  nucleic acid-binding Zn-ribbon protein
MCNPRRVTITATRDLAEAWRREVRRTAGLRRRVAGEARVRQPLRASLGEPALRALEAAFASDEAGWTAVDGGYRRDVEGGYALYSTDDQALEIVAVLEDEVAAEATIAEVLSGEVRGQEVAQAEATYYDDGWGGRTEEHARQDAERAAKLRLDEAARVRVEQAAREAEAQRDEALRARAETAARAELDRSAADRQAALARQAAAHVEAVGLRARQQFHIVLSAAYRNAILAYARRHGAEGISVREAGDTLEIEFRVLR